MKKKIWECRRSVISLFAICCLTYLGIQNHVDVSMAITGIVAAVCGANSYENASAAKSAQGASNANG